ncbi:MAG: glycosyl transferase family 90 [Cypionkella sp.]
MTEAEFIEAQVRHQLGGTTAKGLSQSDDARSYAEAAASGSAVSWCHADAAPRGLNNWQIDHSAEVAGAIHQPDGQATVEKFSRTMQEVLAAGCDFDLIVDMQDRRVRNLRLPDGRLFPTISFNRLRDTDDRVLWPLPLYHDIQDAGFLGGLDPAAVPWSQKDNKIVWRGIPGGRSSPHSDVRREGVRLFAVFRQHTHGELTTEQALALISTFPRHRFVEYLANDPRADVGFIDRRGAKMHKQPLLSAYGRPRITREAMQQSKYLAVVRGNDLASSFFWTMNSGSLGLVMDTPFDSFASCHFQPWVHYVPFREDMSDFEQIFAWCEAHQPECQAMTERAAEVCRYLARADLRPVIAREVIDGIRRALLV